MSGIDVYECKVLTVDRSCHPVRRKRSSDRLDEQSVSSVRPYESAKELQLTCIAGAEFKNDPRNPNAKTVQAAQH
jgi:ATP synthase j chain